MRKKPYLPSREPERITWLNNFASKLGLYATAFGITAAEVTAVGKFALMYAYILGLLETVDGFKQDLTKYKNKLSRATIGSPLGAPPNIVVPPAPVTVPAGIFTIIGGIVQRIKGMKDVYTDAIGEDLGIVGDESSFNADDFKSIINSVKKTNEGIKIDLLKDETDGGNIYSRINGLGSFAFFAFSAHPPFIDTRPLSVPGTPEKREYMVKNVLNDHEIGLESDVVSITVGA